MQVKKVMILIGHYNNDGVKQSIKNGLFVWLIKAEKKSVLINLNG